MVSGASQRDAYRIAQAAPHYCLFFKTVECLLVSWDIGQAHTSHNYLDEGRERERNLN